MWNTIRKTAAAASLLLACTPLIAQNIEIKRVESDSLVNFIRKEYGRTVYFLKADADKNTYTVSGSREELLKKSLDALRKEGYSVSEYDGNIFVFHGHDIISELPTGYFDDNARIDQDSDYLKYINDGNAIASFRNKTYEIGESSTAKNGKAYVSGFIRDVSSGEPLVGVAVYDDKTDTYTMSDAYGFYRLLLPVGENRINYNAYSMEDTKLNVVIYGDGGLDVIMKEKVTSLKAATVSADVVSHHRNAQMGVEKIRINVLTKVPVAFGEPDVLKVIQTLPGVKTVGEASSGYNVRGGSVDQNLILFNDGTVFNPSHMFGVFSAFNTDVINDVELYKSSIPVEYGGRIASVLEVRGREGNNKKVTGSLGLGLLTSRAHVEGPLFSDKTTFILAGRMTYSNWILKMLPENSGYANGKASFYDANIGVNHRFNQKHSLHLNAYYSHDKFVFSSDTTFIYSNLNASLKWRANFNDYSNMTLSVGYDTYANRVEDANNPYSAYAVDTKVSQEYAKLVFKNDLSDRHKLTYGANAIFYHMNPGLMTPLTDESIVVRRALARERALEIAAFAGDSWKISDKFTVDGGVRVTGFYALRGRKFYFAPDFRASGKWSFRDNMSIKFGVNSMNQFIHLLSNTSSISPMDTWKLSDSRIKPQSGWQGSAGYYWTMAQGRVDLSLEGYYKEMKNFLDYKSGAELSMNQNIASDVVATNGKAYGVELMLKKPQGKLNGWLSYTYSRTFLKESGNRGVEAINGGEWYPAAHDKPHDFKLVMNYKFTHRFSFSVNVDYSTGRPVTIPLGRYEYGGGYRLAYSSRNGYRIPDYFRADAAVSIEPSHYLKQFSHMSVTFGCYNITGRKNAYSVYFSSDGKTVTGHMLSVFATQIPYINLNLKF